MKILYVEDQPGTVTTLVRFLHEEWGHEVILAETIEEGLEVLSSKEVDLLLLDVMMKHGDILDNNVPARRTGIEVLRKIRQGEDIGGYRVARDLPVIVITALGDIVDLATLRSFGCVDVIEKPISAELHLKPALERLEREQSHRSLGDRK